MNIGRPLRVVEIPDDEPLLLPQEQEDSPAQQEPVPQEEPELVPV